jgi:hypothetical protein
LFLLPIASDFNRIGGEKAYQSYRQLGIQQKLAQKELDAAYSNYVAHVDEVWSVHL